MGEKDNAAGALCSNMKPGKRIWPKAPEGEIGELKGSRKRKKGRPMLG